MPHQPHRHPLPTLRRVPARRSFAWLAAGWRTFAAHPADWILMALCAFALLAIPAVVLAPVPLIGPMIPPILLTLLLGGMLQVADNQLGDGQSHFLQLFDGFRQHPGNLTLVGVFYALPLILVHLLLILLAGGLLVTLLGSSLGGLLSDLTNTVLTMLVDLGIALGIFLLLWGLLLLAMLFAPALIMLSGVPPLDAMRLSLAASLKNLGAILGLAIMLYVLFALALLPFGFGILLFIPLLVGTLHAAWRDLFGPADEAA